jgi:hypothetical protein
MALTEPPDILTAQQVDRTVIKEYLDTLVAEVEARLVATEAVADAAIGTVKRTVTIDFTTDDFASLANGVKTFSKALSGGALPANAKYLGVVVGTFTGFDDATHGTFTAKLGSTSDDDAILASVNLAEGQTGFPKPGTAGVLGFLSAPLYAEVQNLVITSSVDLNTVTAGHVVVELSYYVRS